MLLTIQIFNRSRSENSINKVVNDLSNDETKHFIGQSTFDFAIGYMNVTGSGSARYLLDQTYFNVKATNI